MAVQYLTEAGTIKRKRPVGCRPASGAVAACKTQRVTLLDDPQIVAQFGTSLQYIDYGQKSVEETAADFQRQAERILKRAMR